MTSITLTLSDEEAVQLREQAAKQGSVTLEQYVHSLVTEGSALRDLEAILEERWDGPFEELSPNWREEVRRSAGF